MVKISGGQLFSLLLIVSSFGLICSNSAYTSGQMSGVLISVAVQAVLVFPLLYLYKHNNFKLQNLPKWLLTIYALYFLLYGGYAFSEFSAVSSEMKFPVRYEIAAVLLVAVVCLYSSLLGLKAIARASVILSAVFAVSVAVLILGAYSKFDMENFSAVSAKEVLNAGISEFIYSSELAVMFVLLGNAEKNRTKAVYGFLAAKLVIAELISFIGVAVLGNLSGIFDFPFFTLGSISQPFSVQRADALYIILLAVLCTMSITIYITMSSALVRLIFPDFKYNETVSTLIMLAVSVVFNFVSGIETWIWAVFTGVMYIGIPLAMMGSVGYSEKNCS